MFSLDYAGLGLPENMYSLFVTMLQNITSSNFNCSVINSTYPVGSNCISTNNSYETETLESLNFVVYFSNQTNSNYVYIPLLSLAFNATASGLGVYCTNSTEYSNTVIFGSSFFNNFLALFEMDLSNSFND